MQTRKVNVGSFENGALFHCFKSSFALTGIQSPRPFDEKQSTNSWNNLAFIGEVTLNCAAERTYMISSEILPGQLWRIRLALSLHRVLAASPIPAVFTHYALYTVRGGSSVGRGVCIPFRSVRVQLNSCATPFVFVQSRSSDNM